MTTYERRRLASMKERLERNDCAGALVLPRPMLLRKASAKAKATRARKSARKAAKSEKRRMSTKEIRAAVMERAKGWCEACCHGMLTRGREPNTVERLELDHWFGGAGRKRQRQSVENCWALCRACHRARQENDPGAAFWNERFRRHCGLYSFPFAPHIVHAQVPAPQAPGAVSGGD